MVTIHPGGHGLRFTVREVLRNPKYAGVLVWSKSTQKLRTKARPTPNRTGLVNKDAFEPIIDQRTFAAAQSLFKMRANRTIPKQELIRSLKRLLAKYGCLSAAMLERTRGKFSPSTYLESDSGRCRTSTHLLESRLIRRTSIASSVAPATVNSET